MSDSATQPLCGLPAFLLFLPLPFVTTYLLLFFLCPLLNLCVILFFCLLIFWLLLWISWAQRSVCSPHGKDVLTGLRRPEGCRVRWLTDVRSGETAPQGNINTHNTTMQLLSVNGNVVSTVDKHIYMLLLGQNGAKSLLKQKCQYSSK